MFKPLETKPPLQLGPWEAAAGGDRRISARAVGIGGEWVKST
jgi:hypothetical protein